ncbi:MAG: hypothetical protein ACK5ZG_03040 [Phycisphaerae bacterium]|jgi:hypothetical protein
MIATSARRFRSLVCCLATAAVAGIALADVPAALDRVPENFEGVVAVPSIEKFEATMVQSLKDLPLGGGGMSVEIQENLSRITETPGVNKQGSVAIFRMPMNAAAKAAAKAKKAEADKAADAGEETDFFAKMEADQAKAREAAERVLMLVPVSDYKAFVEALKGNAADAVAEVTFNMGEAGAEDVDGADADMNKAFVRNIGGGYALMGPSKSTVADFKPVEGKLKAHSEFLGATGRKIAEESLVLAIGNIAEMKDDIGGTFSGLDKNPQIAMATAGAGDQAKKGLATIEMVANNFARDARVGIVGVGLDEKGIWIDFASQFKEGSELAGFFQDKGNVSPIVDRLPNQTFVTMIALDTAGTGMKKLLGEIAKSGGEEAAAMMSGLNTADKMDGFGWMMGASPAGLMGLFSSTSSFTMVKDPQAYLAEVKKSYEAMDGKKIAGMTYKSVYTPEASSIDGVKVDNYTVTQTPDPNDPDAQQALMLQSMMGGGGPTTGLYAPVEGGVVATYSKNNLLMKEAINTAKTAKGVSTTDDVKMLQAYLPADRTMEGYIGVKPVMEMALGAMMMFGMEMDVQLPEKITPIAFGATTSDGAFRARVFVPHDVIAAVGELGKTMQEGMQDQMMPGAEDEEGQAPGF